MDELELLTVRASPIANGNHHVSGSTSKGGSYFLFFTLSLADWMVCIIICGGEVRMMACFFLEKSDCTSNLLGFKIANLNFLCHVTAEKSISSVPSEQTFLHRLLDRGATESSYTTNSSNGSVDKTGFSTRNASTFKCLKHLVQAIDCERVRNDDLAATLRNCLANNGKTGVLAFLSLFFNLWHSVALK